MGYEHIHTPKKESIIMNNKFKITIESPLVRPGIKIETECSEKYLVKVMEKLMELIREINKHG